MGIVMGVVFAKTRHKSQVLIIRTIECSRKEEINKISLFEGKAEVMQVLGSKWRRLHRRCLNDTLKHDPIAVVLKDSCADEFCAVRASVALPNNKHTESVFLIFVGGHDAHHVHIILYACHVSPLSFSIKVIYLLFYVGQVEEGADAPVAAAADYEGTIGWMDQQKLVEVGHGLRVLACRGRRCTGPGVLFWTCLGTSLFLERRPQLVDAVDRPQVDAASLGVLDHIVNGGLGGELLLGSYDRLAEEKEEEGDPARHLWREQERERRFIINAVKCTRK